MFVVFAQLVPAFLGVPTGGLKWRGFWRWDRHIFQRVAVDFPTDAELFWNVGND